MPLCVKEDSEGHVGVYLIESIQRDKIVVPEWCSRGRVVFSCEYVNTPINWVACAFFTTSSYFASHFKRPGYMTTNTIVIDSREKTEVPQKAEVLGENRSSWRKGEVPGESRSSQQKVEVPGNNRSSLREPKSQENAKVPEESHRALVNTCTWG